MKRLKVKDVPGTLPWAQLMEEFEQVVKETPALRVRYPLHYKARFGYSDPTHHLWLGFALGRRFSQRQDNDFFTKSPSTRS
jgi:hypothetical protein